ncbi:unnamed protein product [Prorocentrum cordatum]|uniref:DUF5672 domain-containing protein n=1 Tax=Prorocentrum cordatum TaxID=2364126 RepID=A0ABN9W6Y8_9DINO|nr:unnamed protein product [Polarella glacialis]
MVQALDPKEADFVAYVVRASLRRLGPRWALLVLYGRDADRDALHLKLGSPDSVHWLPIVLDGVRRHEVLYNEMAWFRVSLDFWESVPAEFEHLLFLEGDSMVLRGHGCVESFLDFAYVGAPWKDGLGLPAFGGNGGLSLRRRSLCTAAVAHWHAAKTQAERRREFNILAMGEDVLTCRLLQDMGQAFPTGRESAANFSVETVYRPGPCGFHKPWEWLPPHAVADLFASAEMG